MKHPAIFVNHGGGPLPLLGRQPDLAKHMKDLVQKILPPQKPSSIVVLSAHWESDPIKISSAANPGTYFDYHGFPEECYSFKYPAPGSPELAKKIQRLLQDSVSRVSWMKSETLIMESLCHSCSCTPKPTFRS